MVNELIETMLDMFRKQLGKKEIMLKMKKFANKIQELHTGTKINSNEH